MRDETRGDFGSAVLSLYVRFTPLLDEGPGEIGEEVELDGITPGGTAVIPGVVIVSSALGLGISSDKSCSGSPRFAWSPEHLIDLLFLSLQLVVQARHSVPMRLFLDDQFVLLPLRGSPSIVVLHAHHGHDTQGLSCLLPRSWCDSPENVPSLDGNIRCETISLQFAQPGVYPNFFRMSREIFMFRGTGRSSTGTNGCSSRLSIGRGSSSSITFAALGLITRPSPFRATMCSSVWKRFPIHVPRCHISVMTPSMMTSLQPLIRRFAITHHTAFVQNVRCGLDNPRKQRWDSRLDSKDQKNHSCHLLNNSAFNEPVRP